MKFTLYSLLGVLALTIASCGGSKHISSDAPKGINPMGVRVDKQKMAGSTNLFIEGVKEKALENYNEAIHRFEESIQLNPYNDAAFYELSKLYLSTGAIEKSLENIQMACELDKSNYWYLEHQLNLLHSLKEMEAALPVAEKLVKLSPKNVDYRYKLVNLYHITRDHENAIQHLDSIEAIMGINRDVSMQKEKQYRFLKNKEKAVAEIERLYNYDSSDATNGLILAETYFKYGYVDKVESLVKSLSARFPDNARVFLVYAELERAKGNQTGYYEKLLVAFKSPTINIDLKMKQLMAYFNLIGKEPYDSQATNLSKAMIEAHPRNAKSHAVYADFLYNLNRQEEALPIYRDALALNKNIFTIWHQAMIVAAEIEDYEQTIEIADESSEYFPNQSIIYYIKSIAQLRLKQYEEVIPVIQQGLDLTFDNPALKSELYANQGEAYYKIEKFEEAYNAYDESLKINPDNVIVLNNYSYYLSLREEHLERAKEMSKRSNDLSPNNNSFEDTYAWILYKLKEYTDAIIWMERAIAHGGENSPTIIEHYGDALFQAGRIEDALIQWKKAKDLGSTGEFIDQKIKDGKLYE